MSYEKELTIGALHQQLTALLEQLGPDVPFKAWMKGGNLKSFKPDGVSYNPAFGVYVKATDAR